MSRIPIRLKNRSKYGVRTDKVGKEARTVDGIMFDSLKEARRYQELKLLKLAGKIDSLVLQQSFALKVNGELICIYLADFHYFDREAMRFVTEDCKGFKTDVYKLKKKLMKAIHGIEIKEI